MIGVIANPSEYPVVCEFFELFNTPWEFYRSGRRYEVLLCNGDGGLAENDAELVLLYAGERMPCDAEENVEIGTQGRHAQILSYREHRIPIYGNCVTFQEGPAILVDQESCRPVIRLHRADATTVARLGYDLFKEIRTLLTEGQPADNAGIPTLELHIALMRELIVAGGIPLTEIPPVPEGFRFIACLTHDVDHPSIRRHRWDYTTFGFLYRAIFGSLRSVARGRLRVRDLVKNWTAAFKLPFVHLGLAKDLWADFADRYLELERDCPSTFFVIPFKNRPGRLPNGPAPKRRAARYGARDVADAIGKLITSGREVGLHGIDAWADSSKGSEELEEIRRLTKTSEIGVRMHWLYYDQQSPAALEKAGASYDSTVGYNETIGYRAGTTQVYKPLQANRLLELPLHAMDTALFYPAYLGSSPREARALLERMIDDAVRFGGCLTINWHDRSIAPERLWVGCYRDLIEVLKSRGAWFATAAQAVAWFRKRREAVFEADSAMPSGVRVNTTVAGGDGLPGLRLRVYNAAKPSETGARDAAGYVDLPFSETFDSYARCEKAQ